MNDIANVQNFVVFFFLVFFWPRPQINQHKSRATRIHTNTSTNKHAPHTENMSWPLDVDVLGIDEPALERCLGYCGRVVAPGQNATDVSCGLCPRAHRSDGFICQPCNDDVDVYTAFFMALEVSALVCVCACVFACLPAFHLSHLPLLSHAWAALWTM